ncbi:ly6 plaur, partial [Pristimantis euphronides]
LSAVLSLRCYTCGSQLANDNCLTVTRCPNDTGYCETVMASVSVGGAWGIGITKRCAPYCIPTKSSDRSTSSVSCCSTDLCNVSGGASVRSSCAAILLELGSILIILRSAAQ